MEVSLLSEYPPADVDVHLERHAHEISDGNSTSVMVLIVSSYEFGSAGIRH